MSRFKRLTHLLEAIFGLHVSEGTVSNMLNSMKKFSKKPYEMIRQKIVTGKVAGAQNYATVASVIQTAIGNGQNPFEVLQVIATLALV